ncbi:unnamed protein product [Danaus chrysippus]|uniref:(African queen) hypothetical protein n=1 Tax=Danaus chrysippus TaxID=151541 RepID=A0A8J2QLG9_9NEOP|nr:unnamed protein product [Danaus chrysippus]
MHDKNRLMESNARKHGTVVYKHCNAPRANEIIITLQAIAAVTQTKLRQWAISGPNCKLERAILAGHGRRLLEEEALPLSKYHINLIAKCNALHEAASKGSLLELQALLEGEYNHHKYVMCYDEAGVGLLHKAVFYNFIDIVEWLVKNYPQLVHQRDSLGRTPLHYTAASRSEGSASSLLECAGADRGARDAAGHTIAHYRTNLTQLALPDMPTRPSPPGLVIKRHNIRIWCHECDMGKLQRVVWEGQGARLLSEVSSQPVVKKFLEAVPYIMNTIRDIHNAVIQNDLEGLLKLTADPVPPHALSCRDSNNMTPMHKAAGLGHGGILKYIIERYPQGIKDVDNDGRTPLHYAALVKDDQHTYNTLLGSGADESAVDNKNKTPGYYINKSHDIDKNIFKTLPDAPRTPSNSYPPSWDWKILENDYTADLNKKFKKKNHRTSNENISSKSNTNTISESIETNNGVMKNSSTQELISSFPDLNENDKAEPETTETDENTTHKQEDARIEENSEIEKEVSNNEESSEIENNEDQDQNGSKNIENVDGNNEENVNEKDHNKEGEINDVIHNSNSDVNNTNEENEQDQKENNIVELNNEQEVKDTKNIDDTNNENIEDHNNIKEENDKNKSTEDDKDEVDDKDVNVDMNNTEKEDVVQNNDIHDSLEQNMNESKVDNELEENILGNDSQEDKTDNLNEDISKETNDVINEDLIVGRASSKTSNKEGNICRDNNEDDDDVQVQGSSYPEHHDIHTSSPTLKQKNTSAIRDKSRVSSGTTHQI